MAAEALLPWHQDPWARLWERHRAGRLPHALLCCGPAGLGKRRFAQRFAQALLCQSPDGDGAPCGRCRRCRLFAAGSHPDYLRLEPAEAGKSIAVDQVRRLGEFLGLTSHFGGFRPALLAPADSLNRNAANALLKTLEEPPAAGVLLLVTDAPSRLPATVRSRCQRLAFAPPDPAAALAWLAPQVGGHDPAVLLALAGGSPLTALACSDAETLERRRALFAAFAGVLG
ncbi:MAG: DNA polymerase III subunit delta', partial [Pseudomonadota bacterium]|nr:DNA polymerase III subunit delta' [Pseudomonadota bacterium]